MNILGEFRTFAQERPATIAATSQGVLAVTSGRLVAGIEFRGGVDTKCTSFLTALNAIDEYNYLHAH